MKLVRLALGLLLLLTTQSFAWTHGTAPVPGSAPFGLHAALESNDWILKNSGFTGAADSRYFAASFWLRPGIQECGSTVTVAGNGTGMEIFRSNLARTRILRDTSNRIAVTLSNGTSTFSFRTTSTIVAADAEAHFAIFADTNQVVGSRVGVIIKNGVSETVEITTDTGSAFSADFTEASWAIGATTAGANRLAGVLREFMVWFGVVVDWTNPVTLAKVYGGSGIAVDPGSDGSLVTGTVPIVYLSLRPSDLPAVFLTNRGSGGDYAMGGGAVVKRERGHFAWGDSFRNGANATVIPGLDALFLTNRAFTTAYAWRPRAFPGLGYAEIEAGFFSCITNDLINFEGIVSFEGGINNSAQSTLVVNLNASFVREVNYLLSQRPSAKYLVIGMVKGDPTTMANGMVVGDRITAADALNAATFGQNFLDLNTYLINNRVAVAAASGYTLTANDEADAALGVTPRGFRFNPNAAGTATHLNDIGMKGWQMAETAAWAAIGVTWLLKRDIDPANDNDPMWLEKVA